MKKGINGSDPEAMHSLGLIDRRGFIEDSPALKYLEDNHYYLLKEEKAFKPNGELGAKVLTFINDNLGLEVVLAWPMKTAQVLIVAQGGSQQIVAPMCCLYEKIELLQAFLIDASALRAGRTNPNTSNQR